MTGTVVRRAGPWTPTIHRLLAHLATRGIDWTPRPLGLRDDREIVSHLPGTVPAYPLPDWVWRDEVLVDAATRLAALHETTRDFDATGGRWQLPAHEPAEVICHNDFAPYNLVFDDQHAISGVIDWDTASPGPRAWDLAYLAYRVVPLTRPENPDHPDLEPAERQRRLTLLCGAYGPGVSPADVRATVVPRLGELAAYTAARGPGFERHVHEYASDIAWLRA